MGRVMDLLLCLTEAFTNLGVHSLNYLRCHVMMDGSTNVGINVGINSITDRCSKIA
jgi:hypothetical protein